MANEDKFAKTIEDDELDQVAGGAQEHIDHLAKLMGRPGASADQVAKALGQMGIEVVRWHRKGWFSDGDIPTFREKFVSAKRGVEGQRGWLTYGEVCTVVKGFMNQKNAPTATEVSGTKETEGWSVVD